MVDAGNHMHIENRYDRKRYERDKLEALANEPDSGVYFDESKGRYVRDKFKKKKKAGKFND